MKPETIGVRFGFRPDQLEDVKKMYMEKGYSYEDTEAFHTWISPAKDQFASVCKKGGYWMFWTRQWLQSLKKTCGFTEEKNDND